MVRLTRARPVTTSSAFFTVTGSASLRRPALFAFATGTRRVILSFSKLTTISSSLWPATSCSSIASI